LPVYNRHWQHLSIYYFYLIPTFVLFLFFIFCSICLSFLYIFILFLYIPLSKSTICFTCEAIVCVLCATHV
jgi:hypothetical protein